MPKGKKLVTFIFSLSVQRIAVIDSWRSWCYWIIFPLFWLNIQFFFFVSLYALVGGKEGGHDVRQLQDDHDDAMAAQPQRRASLQRLRTLLQTPQRESLILNHHFMYNISSSSHGSKIYTIGSLSVHTQTAILLHGTVPLYVANAHYRPAASCL